MGAFFVTVFMGFVGTVIDLLFFQMESDFGIILAAATMGSFILSRIGRKPEPDELPAEEPEPEDWEPDESDNNNNTEDTEEDMEQQ